MSDSPYVNFYTSDFLAGTSGMTAACKGVYITLLCQMYEREAPLPQEWETLARRCGCTLPAFKRAVAALVDDGKLTVTDAGIWSEKCDKHIALRRERQNSAKAAAEKRWEKDKQKQRKADATASDEQCQPEPEPEPEPELDIRETVVSLRQSDPRPRRNDASRFDEFWARYPRKVGNGAARKAYDKAIKAIDHDDLMFALSRQLAGMEAKDPQYRPHPATWLNSERWNDEPEHAHDPRGHMPSRPGSGMVDAFAAVAARRLARDGRG